MSGDLENMILSTIERWWGGRYSEKHGLVTSYDPDKYLAKVMFQPSQQESGWLPIETGHIGDGFGIVVGLQPGDGKTTGDQVVVRYHGNDVESGKIVQRVHSEDQKPPRVESGEMMILTRFQKSQGGQESAQGAQGGTGQQVYFKKDGSLNITDGNGCTIVLDGKGDLTVDTTGTIKVTSKGKITVTGQDEIAVTAQKNITVTGNQDITVVATGKMNLTSSDTMTMKSPKIVLDGQVLLGGPDANRPAAALGTVDTKGGVDVGNLAKKVLVK